MIGQLILSSLWLVLLLTSMRAPSPLLAHAAGLRSRAKFLYAGNAFPVIEYMSGKDDGPRGAILSPSSSAFKLVEFYDTAPSSVQMRDTFVSVTKAVTETLVMHHQNTTLETFAVSCEAHSELCEQENAIVELPLFVLLPPSRSVFEQRLTISSQELTKETLLAKMGLMNELASEPSSSARATLHQDGDNGDDSLPAMVLKEEDSQDGSNDAMIMINARPHATRTRAELQNDIHLALDRALRDVYRSSQKPLAKEQREVLKKFLNLLQRTVPRSWNVFSIIQLLLKQFQYIVKKPVYLTKILDSNLPQNPEYSHVCQQEHSGAQCGTWELLHTISVNMVEYNSEQEKAADRLPTLGVAKVFRDYVQTFGLLDDSHDDEEEDLGEMFVREFHACETASGDCHSQYFQLLHKNADDSDVLDWIQLPLFLSEMHNRLHISINKQRPWPSRHDCPSCWNMETGTWNEQTVYRYLQLEYTSKGELLSKYAKAQLLTTPLPPRKGGNIVTMHSSVLGLAAALYIVRLYFTQQYKERRFLDKWD